MIVLRSLGKGLLALLVFFVLAEITLRFGYFVRNRMVSEVPLPYMLGDDYGPAPPWLDRLRLLEPDDALLWRSHPNLHRRYLDMFTPAWSEDARAALLRRFRPVIPDAFRANPVWDVALNSEGFRDDEFPRGTSPGTLRIVCLGDSWTFGANVDGEQTYPRQLRALLQRERPGAKVEVLNLGVLGYSSFQGVRLWKTRAADLDPDVVIIGYAMNDARIAGYRDKDMATARPRPGIASTVANVLPHLESFKLLRYVALTLRDRPRSVGDYIKEAADTAAESTPEAYEKFEAWTRVSPKDYARNINELIDLVRGRGARPILLYNDLNPDSPYRPVLWTVAKSRDVPLVDSSALIAAARRRHEDEIEERLGLRPRAVLRPGERGERDVVFRVYMGHRAVPDAVYVAGTHPTLGDLVPNSVRMYDDGTHGDQRAGDGVWSYSAKLAPGARLLFVYTNSGTHGQWEGLDVPAIRRVTTDANADTAAVYRPIDSFGEMYLQADAWHTNAAGYGLIAQALADVLRKR